MNWGMKSFSLLWQTIIMRKLFLSDLKGKLVFDKGAYLEIGC